MIHQLRMLSLKPFVADDGSMKICKLLLYVRVLRPVIPVVLRLKHPIKLTTRQKKKKEKKSYVIAFSFFRFAEM